MAWLGVAIRDGVTHCMTGVRCPNVTPPPPRLQHLNPIHPESKLSDLEMDFLARLQSNKRLFDIGSIIDYISS